MEGVILAGGKGNRIGLNHNKSLLKYNKRSLLLHNIDILSLHCDKISVLIDYDKESVIKEVLREYNDINFIYQIGDGIINAFSSCKDNIQDDFFLCFGDEKIFNYDIYGMVDYFKRNNFFGVLGVCKRDEKDFDLIKKTYSLDFINNKVLRLNEKPERVINEYQGTGYSIFKKDFFKYINNSNNFPEIIQNAINNGEEVYMYNFCFEYFNINTIEDYEKLQLKRN